MRKNWQNPKLQSLNLTSTKEDISLYGIQAGNGYVFVCNKCNGDPRNDINENDTTLLGNVYTTPNQQCGNCSNNTWRKELASYKPPISS